MCGGKSCSAVFAGSVDRVSVSTEMGRRRLLTGCGLIQRLTKKKNENILFIWNKLVSQLISFNVK